MSSIDSLPPITKHMSTAPNDSDTSSSQYLPINSSGMRNARIENGGRTSNGWETQKQIHENTETNDPYTTTFTSQTGTQFSGRENDLYNGLDLSMRESGRSMTGTGGSAYGGLSTQKSQIVNPFSKSLNSKFNLSSTFVASVHPTKSSRRTQEFYLQAPVSLSKKAAPQLLSQIQSFLARNLPSEGALMKKFVASGRLNSNPEDLKLQLQLERLSVYRESFRMFTDHFKVYKPVLDTIRKEYDQRIESLMKELEDVQEYEGFVKKEGENIQIKIHQLRQAHELKVKKIKIENRDLEEKLQKTLAEEHEIERKIQEMHFSIRELDSMQKEEKNRTASLQDAIQFSHETVEKMKQKLEQSKVEEKSHEEVRTLYSESLMKLGLMDKMIRKEDYLKLVSRNKEEEENIDKLSNQLRVMKRANKRMQEEILHLKMDIEASENRTADDERQLREAKKELLRTHTPRPDWDEIENIIPDMSLESESSVNIAKELERYIADLEERLEEQEMTLQKQSKILSYLVPEEDEDEETVSTENQPYFIGKGMGNDIPKYLRYNGKIKNKNLPKREVENLIQEVWKLRMKQSGSSPFDDAFDTFLSTRYGNVPGIKSEWAYNILDGCRRYRSDPDCDLFLSVLEGEVSEDTYKGQFEMIDKLHQMFVKLDEKENNKATGFVKKKIVNSGLDKFFPGKSSDDLIKIKCMLHIQNPDPIVEYEKLFEEDRDHSQGIFVESIREQFLKEVQSYARDIDRAIHTKSYKGKVSLQAVRQAFYDIDPLLQTSIVDAYIKKAIEHTKLEKADRKAKLVMKEEANEETNWKEEVELASFLRNLKKVLMIRRTKVEQVEEIKERNNKKKKKQPKNM